MIAPGPAIFSDPAQSDLFGGIIEAYRREGFDAGYRRAASDLLAGLVLSSEEFLRDRTNRGADAQELGRIIYAFVDRLERQLDRNFDARGFVEGGLGI